MSRAGPPAGDALLLLGEPALQLGELAVLQLGDLVEVVLALRLLHLEADALDLLAQLTVLGDRGLLLIPLGAQAVGLVAQLRELALEALQALA